MKKLLFLCATLIFFTNQALINSEVQNYMQWHLPQGAKVRLGKGKINDVKFSPDATRLAIASDIGIWIYDAHTGIEIAFLKVQPHGINTANTIAFAPDGKTLAMGNSVFSGGVELWDTSTGELISVLKKDVGSVKDLVFSPDGSILACTSWYRQVEFTMWEVATGKEMYHFIGPQESLYGGLALSPDAHSVASAGRDTIYLWDAYKGKLSHTIQNTKGWALAFSPDSKTLVGGSTTLHSWESETGKELSEFKEHTRQVETITFSPDGKTFASGDTGGKIVLWDFELSNQETDNGDKKLTLPNVLRSLTDKKKQNVEKQHVNRILMGHTLPIEALDYTADGKMLASGSNDGTLKVWNVDTGKEQFTIHGHTGSVKALQFFDTEKRFALARLTV